ncbi:unnamed protein product [Rhizophagus irregularis]|uniref:Uncharacterized protein n=1 Tax=Rhizophagus irregularis TaxID=588596 RepID=A0A915YPJ8_9GLOM|nr:unnamed protein product [Rhizophagus irregularis]CAB5166155.1 unnamed protein product [Rhizophagus irregularis]CAB5302267.1 unnamed protein product [Rhizophagus irregularis]
MKDYLDESVNWRINNLTTPALLIAMRTPLLNLVITSYYLLYQIKQRDAHLKKYGVNRVVKSKQAIN